MALSDLQGKVQQMLQVPDRGHAQQADREAVRDYVPRGPELGFVHPQTHASLLLRDTGDIDLFVAPHTGLRLHKETQTATLFAQAVQMRSEELRMLLDLKLAIEAAEAIRAHTKAAQLVADNEVAVKTQTLRAEAESGLEVKAAKATIQVEDKTELQSQTLETRTTTTSMQASQSAKIESPSITLDGSNTEITGALSVGGPALFRAGINGPVTFNMPPTEITIGHEPLDHKVTKTLNMWMDLQNLSIYLQSLYTWMQAHIHGDPVSGVTTPPPTPPPPPPTLANY